MNTPVEAMDDECRCICGALKHIDAKYCPACEQEYADSLREAAEDATKGEQDE